MSPRDGTARTDHRPVVGFALVLACAAASLGGPQAYVGLTDTVRWAWTDLVLALVALAGCRVVFAARHAPTRIPLYLATLSALALLAAQPLQVYLAFHSTEDDFLSSEIWVLGNLAMAVCAILGLVLAVSTRAGVVAAPPRR